MSKDVLFVLCISPKNFSKELLLISNFVTMKLDFIEHLKKNTHNTHHYQNTYKIELKTKYSWYQFVTMKLYFAKLIPLKHHWHCMITSTFHWSLTWNLGSFSKSFLGRFHLFCVGIKCIFLIIFVRKISLYWSFAVADNEISSFVFVFVLFGHRRFLFIM